MVRATKQSNSAVSARERGGEPTGEADDVVPVAELLRAEVGGRWS
jgi:hypothetical protein